MRRTLVVGIFPNREGCLRLIRAPAAETDDRLAGASTATRVCSSLHSTNMNNYIRSTGPTPLRSGQVLLECCVKPRRAPTPQVDSCEGCPEPDHILGGSGALNHDLDFLAHRS